MPFFTSAGAGDIGSYRGSVLPSATLSGRYAADAQLHAHG